MTGLDAFSAVFLWVMLGAVAGILVWSRLVMPVHGIEWKDRPAAAVAFLVALAGPVALAVVLLHAAWIFARYIRAGFVDLFNGKRGDS